MHDETPADLARVLRFAATYMEEHGRARLRFGSRPGGPLCPVAAIGLGLGFHPRRLGWRWFFLPPNRAQCVVGRVILRTGLLDRLPLPAQAHGPRKPRRASLTPIEATHELARWADDKALDGIIIGALRATAYKLEARGTSASVASSAIRTAITLA